MSKEYGVDSIRKLTAMQHIRKKPGMYIGDTDTPKHLFHEALDNALDELQNKYATEVIVKIDTINNSYTVIDNGRGIPFGKKTFEDGSVSDALIALCTDAFVGGKFDDDYGGSFKTGTHGIGLKCINALSDKFEITSIRDNKIAKLSCINGGVQESYVVQDNYTINDHGTKIIFIPSKEVFDSVIIPINFIIDKCKISNAFGNKVKLLIDEEEKDVNSDLTNLLPDLEDGIVKFFDHSFTVKDKDSDEYCVIEFEYTSDTSWYYRGYTNLLYNSAGGTHLRMFDQAVIDAWRKYDLGECLDKDLFLGIRAVVAVFIKETSFSSQTKDKLTVDKSYFNKFIPMISKEINKFLDNNDSIRNGLIKRFKEHRAYVNKSASQKELNNLLITNNDTKTIRRRTIAGTKLRDCTNSNKENSELFICEGDSALGSIVQARNSRTQAVLPLRGKILNVSKLDDINTCMKNEEIRSIVNCIGAGLFDECNPDISRYEKIIILCDSDPDGYNIAALVVGLFINVLPNIVKSGMVYVAKPALYGWKTNNGYEFSNDIKDIPSGVQFTRYKGLGEMDPDELKYSMVDPDYRSLMQVEYPDDLGEVNSILTSSKVKFKMLEDMNVIKYV